MRTILKAVSWLHLVVSAAAFALTPQAARDVVEQAQNAINGDSAAYLAVLEPYVADEVPPQYRGQFLSYKAHALLLNDAFANALELADLGLGKVADMQDADAALRLWETKVVAEIELALYEDAAQSNERMLQYSLAQSHCAGEAKARVFRMYFHLQQNRWAEALKSIQQAYRAAYHRETLRENMEVRAVVNHELGRIYERFDAARAITYYREAIALSRHNSNTRDRLITMHRLAILLLDANRPAEAQALILQLEQEAAATSVRSPLFSAYTSHSRLALMHENTDAARRAFAKATALLPDIQSRELLRAYFLQQARLLQRGGEHTQLVALLQRNEALFPDTLRSHQALSFLTLMAESQAALGADEQAYLLEQARLKLYRQMKADARQIQQEEMRMNLQQEQEAWIQRLRERDQLAVNDSTADYRWRTLLAASLLIILLLCLIVFVYVRPGELRRKNAGAYERMLFQREVKRRLKKRESAEKPLQLFYIRVEKEQGMTERCEQRLATMLDALESELADSRRDNDICYRLDHTELVLLLDRDEGHGLQSQCARLSSKLACRFRDMDCCHTVNFSSLFVTVDSPNLQPAALFQRVEREFKLRRTMADMIAVAW